MRSAAPLVAALLPILLLTACSSASDEPGGVTADEASQLNDAAAMLDAESMNATALDGNAAEMP